jgi:hypothetical protein
MRSFMDGSENIQHAQCIQVRILYTNNKIQTACGDRLQILLRDK